MLSRILFLFIFCSSSLFGVEGAISVSTVPQKKYFISQEMIVKVDLKTTAFSITNAKIHLENSDDFIILTPKSASSIETQDIDDEDWQIVHYEYKLYPLHSGTIKIKPFSISFEASMGYGQPKKKFNLLSQTLEFNVDAPKGVKQNNFVLSTESYSLKSEISPPHTKELKVGDAITFKVIQSAKNVPDILLESKNLTKNRYFKIYEEEPLLNTDTKGSSSIAQRTDAYTYLATKEGNTTIAPQVFIWWDSKNQILHKAYTPQYDFIILPAPKTEVIATEKDNILSFTLKFFYLFIVLFLLYKIYPILRARRSQKAQVYKESEEGCFKTLLHSGNYTEYYQNFYIWLGVINPILSREGFQALIKIQPTLKISLEHLEEVLVNKKQKFNKRLFKSEVKKLRKKIIYEKNKESLSLSINPQ